MIDRKAFLAGGAAASAAVAVRGRAAAADPFRLIVTETDVPLVPNSVEWLALSLGYFQKAGVNVQLVKVQQTPSAIAALRSGEGEMANVGTDVVLQLLGRDQMDVRGVISPDKALPFAIVAKKGITTPKDLEGKTFGVARVGSVDYETSRVVLAKLGVAVDKLQYLSIGQPAVRMQSLLAGQIDATAVSIGTYASVADKSGIGVVVDQNDFFKAAPFVTKINIVTTDVAKARPKDVGAVVRALIMASRDFAKTPSIWVNAMAAARPDLKRADLETLAAAYRKSWSVNGGLNMDAIKFTTAQLYKSPDFKDVKPIDPSSWVDVSYVDAVLKSNGVDHTTDDAGR
jgi:NitT/TauT family transport system substrate-binding protein